MKNISGRTFLYFISLVAAMGGLMFGFDIAIITGAIPFIQPYFGLDELSLGYGVSSLLFGCIFGSMFSGMLTDKFGRKKILLIVALIFALSSAATGMAKQFGFFIAARFVGGLAVGAASVLSPMYIAEVSPSKNRGTLVAIYQLTIVGGILVSYCINYFLHDTGVNNWRWMFATGVIPSAIFFLLLFFIPESPRWLYKFGKKQEAYDVLVKAGGKANADYEIVQIEESLRIVNKNVTFLHLLKPDVRKAVWVGFLIAVFVQISGINTVVDYAPKILIKAGFEIKSALLQTSFIGLVNCVFTFIAIWLIDKVGRKPLYIVGSAGMTLTTILVALSFHFNLDGIFVLVCIMLYIAFFAACIGPVFWTLVSELFPNKVRGTAISFTSLVQWVFNWLVVSYFPWVLHHTGGAFTFGILAVFSALQIIITLVWVPETKGKTLEQIEKDFAGRP
jgi:sugar porter (SP) family MFS transporter